VQKTQTTKGERVLRKGKESGVRQRQPKQQQRGILLPPRAANHTFYCPSALLHAYTEKKESNTQQHPSKKEKKDQLKDELRFTERRSGRRREKKKKRTCAHMEGKELCRRRRWEEWNRGLSNTTVFLSFPLKADEKRNPKETSSYQRCDGASCRTRSTPANVLMDAALSATELSPRRFSFSFFFFCVAFATSFLCELCSPTFGDALNLIQFWLPQRETLLSFLLPLLHTHGDTKEEKQKDITATSTSQSKKNSMTVLLHRISAIT
jgi:hypothetical protein